MYNRERKVQFQQQYTTNAATATVVANIFESLAKYEEKYDMDICQMDAESMQSIFDEVAGLKCSSIDNVLYILKSYSRWCLLMGFPGANDSMSKIENAGIKKLRDYMISGPLELAIYLDKTHNSVAEDCLVDNVWRCYDWLAFMGVDEADILDIKTSDVITSTMVVRCHGKEYDIPKEAYTVFRNLVRLTEFKFRHSLYSEDIERLRAPGDVLLRSYAPFESVVDLRDRVSRKRIRKSKDGQSMKKLSYKRIQYSGIFFRAYELERAGLIPDFTEEINHRMSKLQPTGVAKNEKSKLKYKMQLIRDIQTDYKRWKMAFVII